MLYYLFGYLSEKYHLIGAGVFQYITFRAAMAVITSLVVSIIIGKRIIEYLRKKQIGETVRDLGLHGQIEKQGTPTMGGFIILASILIPTLLFAKLGNVYIVLMVISTIWLGIIGFIDDYIKVFKKDKKGLAGTTKIIGQIVLGLIVGITLYFNKNVVVCSDLEHHVVEKASVFEGVKVSTEKLPKKNCDVKEPITTIPFVKNNEFNYSKLISFLGNGYEKWSFLIYIPIVILIITAVSNGANITDGIDGLATGVSAIIAATLGIFAYVSGNIVLSEYLNIMYIPKSGELVIFSASLIGACIGFLWYNSFPAKVFMGDTGSLALGGIIAALAIAVRKELLIPILCGIFLIENLSVIIQVTYFKYTKKKYGEGRRIFKMSPLHHHFQKKGMHEAKIVTRFWIVGILLAVLTIVTLKLR